MIVPKKTPPHGDMVEWPKPVAKYAEAHLSAAASAVAAAAPSCTHEDTPAAVM
jgi:hypothetical protein